MAANITVDEIAPMVAELRESVSAGRTRPLAHRRKQLTQLRLMLTEHYNEVHNIPSDFRVFSIGSERLGVQEANSKKSSPSSP